MATLDQPGLTKRYDAVTQEKADGVACTTKIIGDYTTIEMFLVGNSGDHLWRMITPPGENDAVDISVFFDDFTSEMYRVVQFSGVEGLTIEP